MTKHEFAKTFKSFKSYYNNSTKIQHIEGALFYNKRDADEFADCIEEDSHIFFNNTYQCYQIIIN